MEDGVRASSTTGTPQGGTISPLLSNVYGHALDALWTKEMSALGTMIRFADDAVIVCHSEAAAQQAYAWLQERSRGLRLVLHPQKTRVLDLTEGRDGFDFLGFHIRLVRSWKWGRWYCQQWPSHRALAALRAKIKEITGPRSLLPLPIEEIVKRLNPVLRAGAITSAEVTRPASSPRSTSTFMSAWRCSTARSEAARDAAGRNTRTGGSRASTWFSCLGASAIPDRDNGSVNTVGEPDEGKPHVRFDEGRLARRFPAGPVAYSTVYPRSYAGSGRLFRTRSDSRPRRVG